jgi:uncharacterized membrane protein (UPF0127 family)
MKSFSSNFILAICIVGVLLLSWKSFQNHRTANIRAVEIGSVKVFVDIANTRETQEQGLSGRINLKSDEGMLFVFPRPDKYSFWMKDMLFPLDIIWLNNDLKIVYIKKDASPRSFPESYAPPENSRYVLEVTAGFAEKNNLKVGDVAKFTY